jgi:hypothetical protein
MVFMANHLSIMLRQSELSLNLGGATITMQ